MVQYHSELNVAFATLADPTRRGILTRLGRSDAALSELAETFDMSLPGISKHVRLLETAGLIRTTKIGRVRHCRLAARRLTHAAAWLAAYQRMIEERADRLGDFLERTAERS
jgi:DNA-binding transcriptional ArsR family regulator